MPRASLEELLERLHHELARPDDFDADTLDRLEKMRSEIETVLDRPEPLEDHLDERASSLGVELDEAIADFEDSHPNLTARMRRVIQAFRAIGFS